MTQRKRFRELIAGPRAVIAPGCANALTARIIEEAGFKATMFTGAGFANMEFGLPDMGLTTLTEIVQQVGRIVDAVDIPVIADADTGYGNPLNVGRTIRELEHAGAAAIALEDQVFPKRCGHFEGKRVIPAEEMVIKLKAAVDARRDPDLVIIARTDARAVYGIEDAIRRAQMYAEAGADVTFVEAPQTVEEMAAVAKQVKVPQLVNIVEGGKTPELSLEELDRMGFRLVVYANCALRAAILGMKEVLATLARDGGTSGTLDRMVTWQERQRLVRLPEYQKLDEAYATPAAKAAE